MFSPYVDSSHVYHKTFEFPAQNLFNTNFLNSTQVQIFELSIDFLKKFKDLKGKVNSNERMASQIAKRGITTAVGNMSGVQNAATAGHGGNFNGKYKENMIA